MKKLFELLNLIEIPEGDFGVEIECEGKNLAVAPKDKWSTVDDGSLRGRFPDEKAEWVFTKPLFLDDAIKAVSDLAAYQANHNAQLDFSFRTSVHVHMNVQSLTFDQYLNTIYTYLLLENVLVRYCGNERIGNRFCLRMQDAEGLSDMLSHLFRVGPVALRNFNKETAKYAAINIAATNNYGSLEFRAMQGNLSVPYISTWLKALFNIREFAKACKNPQEVHDVFVKTSPSEFMEMVLKDVYPFFSYKDEVNDIRHAFSITLDLPYAYITEESRAAQRAAEVMKREAELRLQYEREQQRMQDRMERDIRLLKDDLFVEPNPLNINPAINFDMQGIFDHVAPVKQRQPVVPRGAF